MIQDVLILVLGLTVLAVGGEFLVRGASAIARRIGVSSLVIGLTIVAFGTSAPELAININAAIEGRGDISFGNIVGSCIANVGLIVGTSALLRPLAVHKAVIQREIPMMLLACAASIVLVSDSLFGEGVDEFGRGDGAMLLLLFLVFLYYTLFDAIKQRKLGREAAALKTAAGEPADAPAKELHPVLAALAVAVGFAGLVWGADLTVESASALAKAFGVPDVVIGLTVVAVGTSLPELVTAIVATVRGQSDIAMGNVVGSNIFNLLLVLGVTSVIAPIPLPAGGVPDLALMTLMAAVLLPLSLNSQRKIGRVGGLLLLATYGAYNVWRALG
jgi:cation:H+ antiporter